MEYVVTLEIADLQKKKRTYLYLATRLLDHNPASTRYVTGSPGLPQRASRPLEQTCMSNPTRKFAVAFKRHIQ